MKAELTFNEPITLSVTRDDRTMEWFCPSTGTRYEKMELAMKEELEHYYDSFRASPSEKRIKNLIENCVRVIP